MNHTPRSQFRWTAPPPDDAPTPDALLLHRATIVRRLLDGGIRRQTLATLLPGWEHLLAAAEDSGAATPDASPHRRGPSTPAPRPGS